MVARKNTDMIQIEKGQFAAIVGPSGKLTAVTARHGRNVLMGSVLGCGKTSVISLLER
jgi:ABC-type lipoprotein export system ATPase subunit